jgi:hypothetical protein
MKESFDKKFNQTFSVVCVSSVHKCLLAELSFFDNFLQPWEFRVKSSEEFFNVFGKSLVEMFIHTTSIIDKIIYTRELRARCFRFVLGLALWSVKFN